MTLTVFDGWTPLGEVQNGLGTRTPPCEREFALAGRTRKNVRRPPSINLVPQRVV